MPLNWIFNFTLNRNMPWKGVRIEGAHGHHVLVGDGNKIWKVSGVMVCFSQLILLIVILSLYYDFGT